MASEENEACAFPGCSRPVAEMAGRSGRPSRYCDLEDHNAQTAFREKRRRIDPDDASAEGSAERPVSFAGMTLRGVAQRFHEDSGRVLEAIAVLADPEQLDAELAAVRADTQAEVGHAKNSPSQASTIHES